MGLGAKRVLTMFSMIYSLRKSFQSPLFNQIQSVVVIVIAVSGIFAYDNMVEKFHVIERKNNVHFFGGAVVRLARVNVAAQMIVNEFTSTNAGF